MILKIGSRGKEVVALQARLTQWGFPTKADGIFGPKTHNSVQEFQKAMGLLVDGIVGPKTSAALKQDVIKVTHFKKAEFKCKCNRYCNGYINRSDEFGGMSYALLILLERIRAEVGRIYGREIPCTISRNGGYRCPQYNRIVGGASRSLHIYGKAADISFKGVPVRAVNEVAIRMNPHGGKGLGGANITHVDVRGHHSQWYYN